MGNLLDVIMPTYNDGKYLKDAIESILSQTFKDFRFIIINDASTDNTSEIVKGFKDPRIIYIENKENKGLPKNLNDAIKSSTAKYIARMDGDDISEPGRLEKQVSFLDGNPKYVMCGTQGFVIDERGQAIGKLSKSRKDWVIRAKMIDYNQFIHGSILIDRIAILKAGMYNVNYERGQDYALWFEVMKVGRVANLPESLYRWRDRNNNRINSPELMLKQRDTHEKVVKDILSSGRFRKEIFLNIVTKLISKIKHLV